MSVHRAVRELMGMPISVHVRAPEGLDARVGETVERAYSRLQWIDRTFSTFAADSVVSRIGRGEVSIGECAAPVREVAELCAQAERVTGGAFSAEFRAPRVKAARVDADGFIPAVFGGAHLDWDPTGLVKGWAIAQAGRILTELDGCAWSINAGGDVLVGRSAGVAPDRWGPWRIGIEDPRSSGTVVEVVELTDGAVCTSGTAARGAHLVDPLTGNLTAATGSVTVIGPDVVWADVWATALFVGGQETEKLLAGWGAGYRVLDQRAVDTPLG